MNCIPHTMFCGDKIEKHKISWPCGACGSEECVYRALLGKSDGRGPLGRTGRRWVNNIRMVLNDAVCTYMDWIGLAQD